MPLGSFLLPLPELLSRRGRIPRTLVFSSVGDRGQAVNSWLGSHPTELDRQYDTAVVYYGDQPQSAWAQSLRLRSDWYGHHRGGKFQNLVWLLRENPSLLAEYDYVLATDDDIAMSADGIGRQVRTAREYDLPISSASHAWEGRISWRHMGARGSGERINEPPAGVELCNFVEMTCPLFETGALETFLGQFIDSGAELTGWGDDWLMSNACFTERRPFGVLHNVTVVNPRRRPGPHGEVREIDQLHSEHSRIAAWTRARARLGARLTVKEEIRTWLPPPRMRCINLERANERRQQIIDQWIDGLGFPVRFFSAVDRRDIEQGFSYFPIDEGAALRHIGRSLTAGEIACSMSHALMVREELEFCGPEGVLILEDDASPLPGAEQIVQRVQAVARELDGVEAIACHQATEHWGRGASCEGGARVISPPWGAIITWYNHQGLRHAEELLTRFDQPADWIWRDFSGRGAYALLEPAVATHRGEATFIGNEHRGICRPFVP